MSEYCKDCIIKKDNICITCGEECFGIEYCNDKLILGENCARIKDISHTELYSLSLIGHIYHDYKKRWTDGAMFVTSAVIHVEDYDECYGVYTLNSIYIVYKEDCKIDLIEWFEERKDILNEFMGHINDRETL